MPRHPQGILPDWPLILAALFLLIHFALRVLTSPSLNVDEADLVLFSQSWQGGYSDQPPLYSWLLRPWIAVFGISAASLDAFRMLLLATIIVLIDRSSLTLTGHRKTAAISACCVLLIPMFAWSALTYLSHTLLMSALAVATFWASIQVIRRGNWTNYVVLGVIVALGAQSKYNFAIFVASLFLSGLTIRRFRERILTKRMLLGALAGLTLLIPHATWLYEHRVELTGQYLDKAQADSPAALGVPMGVISLIQNVFLLALPGLACCFWSLAPLFRRQRPVECDERADLRLFESWICRYISAVVGIHMLIALLAGAGRMHERWLEPFFILVPAWICCRLVRIGARSDELGRLRVVLMVTVMVLTIPRLGQLCIGTTLHGAITSDFRWDDAARELAAYNDGTTVLVCDDRGLAGNLRRLMPDLPAVTPQRPLAVPETADDASRYILLWREDSGTGVPEQLADWVEERFDVDAMSRVHDGTIVGQPLFLKPETIRFHFAVVSQPRVTTGLAGLESASNLGKVRSHIANEETRASWGRRDSTSSVQSDHRAARR